MIGILMNLILLGLLVAGGYGIFMLWKKSVEQDLLEKEIKQDLLRHFGSEDIKVLSVVSQSTYQTVKLERSDNKILYLSKFKYKVEEDVKVKIEEVLQCYFKGEPYIVQKIEYGYVLQGEEPEKSICVQVKNVYGEEEIIHLTLKERG